MTSFLVKGKENQLAVGMMILKASVTDIGTIFISLILDHSITGDLFYCISSQSPFVRLLRFETQPPLGVGKDIWLFHKPITGGSTLTSQNTRARQQVN